MTALWILVSVIIVAAFIILTIKMWWETITDFDFSIFAMTLLITSADLMGIIVLIEYLQKGILK